ncbi:Zinc finger RING-type [Penicillium sp. DV-2018c]|nr:Zinc finger RING-type [Penicillium sp. DV-2018c]
MYQSFDLPDSTDWLETPLSLLAPFETALRCQVCKDFFDNPVITSCSHTFCSLCIRRCLSAEGKCPTCRSSDQELKLRRNWAVQELVDAFMTARPSVLGLARMETARLSQGKDDTEKPAEKKRKVNHVESEEAQVPDASSQGRQTRSQTSNRSTSQHAAPQAMPNVVKYSQNDEEYVPEDGLVACPICQRRMKEEAVFPHLSVHEQEEEPAAQTPTKPASFNRSLHTPSQTGLTVNSYRPERLPAINYSLLKDISLRKKLRDLGIPDWGQRQLLQRRHTEWMNLWNANCDSKNPKSKRALLQELDIWERTQGGHAAGPSPFASSNNVMRKEFDANEWSTNHDDDFKRLIANARQKTDTAVRSTIPGASAPSYQPAKPQEQRPAQLPVHDARSDELPRQFPNAQFHGFGISGEQYRGVRIEGDTARSTIHGASIPSPQLAEPQAQRPAQWPVHGARSDDLSGQFPNAQFHRFSISGGQYRGVPIEGDTARSTIHGASIPSSQPAEPQDQRPAQLPVDGARVQLHPDVDAANHVIDLSK